MPIDNKGKEMRLFPPVGVKPGEEIFVEVPLPSVCGINKEQVPAVCLFFWCIAKFAIEVAAGKKQERTRGMSSALAKSYIEQEVDTSHSDSVISHIRDTLSPFKFQLFIIFFTCQFISSSRLSFSSFLIISL